jgi:hypothetical protein
MHFGFDWTEMYENENEKRKRKCIVNLIEMKCMKTKTKMHFDFDWTKVFENDLQYDEYGSIECSRICVNIQKNGTKPSQSSQFMK